MFVATVTTPTAGPPYVYRAGSGQPLVLLHGMGESSIGWRPVLDRLSAEFDVLAIDLPGFDGPRLCRTGAALTVANLAAATVTEPAEM